MNVPPAHRPTSLLAALTGIDRRPFLTADEEEDLAAAVHALLSASPAGFCESRSPATDRGVIGLPWLAAIVLLTGTAAAVLVRWLGHG